jgi:hypothetical protein
MGLQDIGLAPPKERHEAHEGHEVHEEDLL